MSTTTSSNSQYIETFAKVAVNTRLILSRSPKSGAISRKYSSFKLRKTSPSILCLTIFFQMFSEIVGISFLSIHLQETELRNDSPFWNIEHACGTCSFAHAHYYCAKIAGAPCQQAPAPPGAPSLSAYVVPSAYCTN